MTETLTASPKAKRLAQLLNEKKARQREEIAEAVEAFRREQEEYQRSMPTHERMSKGDIKRVVVKGEGVRFQPRRDVLKRFDEKWQPTTAVAFMRLMDDAKAREATGITMNYSGGGSSRSSHDRIGGISNAHREKIIAGNRFDTVMSALPARLQRLCGWLLLGEHVGATGQQPKLEDVGRWLFAHMRATTWASRSAR
jgi:hypothetical protein